MAARAVLILLALALTGCAGYRGPGTYADQPCYSCASASTDPALFLPPPMRWNAPPYPGGPIFRSQ